MLSKFAKFTVLFSVLIAFAASQAKAQTGACCLQQCPYTCDVTTADDCASRGGAFTFGGDGSTCAANPCGTLPTCCKGDVNGDGIADGDDIQPFVEHLLNPGSLVCGSHDYCTTDANDNGVIDDFDAEEMANILLTDVVCPSTMLSCSDATRCQIADRLDHGGSQTLAATSDRNANAGHGYWVAEDIHVTGAGSISQLCWTGIYYDFASDCNGIAVDDFQVTYYSDDGVAGGPGTVIAGPFLQSGGTLTGLTRTATGNLLQGIAEFEYHATHAPVAVAANACVYVEISDAITQPCAWFWSTSPPGNGHSYQDIDTVSGPQYANATFADYDLALCVGPGPMTISTNGCTVAGPPNDLCADAIAVGEGTIAFTTVGALNDGSANCGVSATAPDAWFLYTPTCSGGVTIRTCGSAYDTVISAHTGCPGTTANQLGCNDDCTSGGCNGSLQSCLVINVTENVPVLIRVSGFAGNTGNGALTITCGGGGGGPANDNCASATPVGEGSFPFSTDTATVDGDADCGFANGADVWFAYTPTCSGIASIDTCGASYDTVISVHSDCPGTIFNEVDCNDDCNGSPCAPLSSCLTVPTSAGITVFICVSGFAGDTGSGTLHIACTGVATPANDNCTAAIAIGDGIFPFDTTAATTDGPDEPGLCDFFGYTQVDSDIWYCYTASCTGTATASLCGSTYDTKVAIYATDPICSCPTSEVSAIACNEDFCDLQSEVTFGVTEGSKYLIRIGGYFGDFGPGVLTVSCAP